MLSWQCEGQGVTHLAMANRVPLSFPSTRDRFHYDSGFTDTSGSNSDVCLAARRRLARPARTFSLEKDRISLDSQMPLAINSDQ